MKIPLISNPNGSVIYIFHEWKTQECHQAQLFYHLYSFMDCGVNRKKSFEKKNNEIFCSGSSYIYNIWKMRQKMCKPEIKK